MRGLARSFETFLRDEDGPTAVEYAIVLALIILVCIAAIITVGTATNNILGNAVLKNGLTSGGAAAS